MRKTKSLLLPIVLMLTIVPAFAGGGGTCRSPQMAEPEQVTSSPEGRLPSIGSMYQDQQNRWLTGPTTAPERETERSPAIVATAKPGTWQVLEPVPTATAGVEGMSVASVGNKIIAALGYEGADSNRTRIYDIASNTWSFGAPAPGISSEGAGVSHGGLFYTAGGRSIGPRDDLWSYSPASNTWTVLSPMNTGRTGLALAAHGNAIYAFGGRENTGGPCSGNPIASAERYDIDTDTWTPIAPMPFALSDRAAATVGGKIYLFGGCVNQATIVKDVDVYNPVTDTWSTAPADLPSPRAAFYGVATKGNAVYVIGGWDGIQPGLHTNQAYHVAHDTWTNETPMPTNRAEAGAVGHGGRIFIVGGGQPGFGASTKANEAYKP